MARSSFQKLKIIYVMEYLLKYSDEEHPVTTNQIIAYLQSHNIAAEHKNICSDIESLRDCGLDINQVSAGNCPAFFCHAAAAFLILHHVVVVLNKFGDILAGGLTRFFSFLRDALVEVDWDLGTRVFCFGHSSFSLPDCNASIAGRQGESSYQHHQETMDKVSRSNECTQRTKKGRWSCPGEGQSSGLRFFSFLSVAALRFRKAVISCGTHLFCLFFRLSRGKLEKSRFCNFIG